MLYDKTEKLVMVLNLYILGEVGLVVSMSASHAVGRGFSPRSGYTKDHNKNGTNCDPAWHACVKVGV